MDIKLTESALRHFLETSVSAEKIAEMSSLCGPTFDRINQFKDETAFDIEVITNRIDMASAQGIAREVNAILNQHDIQSKFTNDPYKRTTTKPSNLPEIVKIKIENQELCPRFVAITISDLKNGDSPASTVKLLEASGERSINSLVDITNELTLLYGMPSHIFDLDKIADKKITIRESRPGESLTTLDNQKCELKGDDIVIEDGSGQLIDLCGIMGGSKAVVDQNTTNILFIVPAYQPKKIRKTSLYLQKRTIAAQIYEKSPDTEICLPVLEEGIKLFTSRSSGWISSKIFDHYPHPIKPKTIKIKLDWLEKFIGTKISNTEVKGILENLGFKISITGKVAIITVPSFRYYDINIKEDLAEEIARVYGYQKLPSALPPTTTPQSSTSKVISTEYQAKNYLAALGYHEVFNNSLISEKQLSLTGIKLDNSLRLTNSLSSDYEYLRPSLIPSLLANFQHNQGKNIDRINLFELSNIYQQNQPLPNEISTLSFVSNDSFVDVKGITEATLKHLKCINIQFGITQDSIIFSSNQTATIYLNGQLAGHIGSINPAILNQLGISTNVICAEINFETVVKHISPQYQYTPVSEFPEIIEDVTLVSSMHIGELVSAISQSDPLITNVQYLSSFQNKHTFKIYFGSQTKNIDRSEVEPIKAKLFQEFKG